MQLATETFQIKASLLHYLPFLSEEITNVPKFDERHFVVLVTFYTDELANGFGIEKNIGKQ